MEKLSKLIDGELPTGDQRYSVSFSCKNGFKKYDVHKIIAARSPEEALGALVMKEINPSPSTGTRGNCHSFHFPGESITVIAV